MKIAFPIPSQERKRHYFGKYGIRQRKLDRKIKDKKEEAQS